MEFFAALQVAMQDTTTAVRFPEKTGKNGEGQNTPEPRETVLLSGSVPFTVRNTVAVIPDSCGVRTWQIQEA